MVLMGIVEFLTARYDEIEKAARGSRSLLLIVKLNRAMVDGSDEMATYRHFEHHDPASVLLDLKAKRRLAGLHSYEYGEFQGCRLCDVLWPCGTLKLLAQPFAAHPDYNPGWALPELIEEGRVT